MSASTHATRGKDGPGDKIGKKRGKEKKQKKQPFSRAHSPQRVSNLSRTPELGVDERSQTQRKNGFFASRPGITKIVKGMSQHVREFGAAVRAFEASLSAGSTTFRRAAASLEEFEGATVWAIPRIPNYVRS